MMTQFQNPYYHHETNTNAKTKTLDSQVDLGPSIHQKAAAATITAATTAAAATTTPAMTTTAGTRQETPRAGVYIGAEARGMPSLRACDWLTPSGMRGNSRLSGLGLAALR